MGGKVIYINRNKSGGEIKAVSFTNMPENKSESGI